MIPNNQSGRRKGGRNPKEKPAVFRYSIRMNVDENDKFLSLFEQSGEADKAHFITSCIFNRPIKVVKIDKGVQDYYMRMTTFFGQYRAIGTNYNQVVKALKSNFAEKKALAFLYKLEKATLELVTLQKQMMQLTEDQRASLNEGKTVYVSGLTDRNGKNYNGYITWKPEDGKTDFMFATDYKKALEQNLVKPDDRHKVQVAVNSEGKTNEATKKVKEPLEQGQTAPTEKQKEKQENKQEQEESQQQSRGVRR